MAIVYFQKVAICRGRWWTDTLELRHLFSRWYTIFWKKNWGRQVASVSGKNRDRKPRPKNYPKWGSFLEREMGPLNYFREIQVKVKCYSLARYILGYWPPYLLGFLDALYLPVRRCARFFPCSLQEDGTWWRRFPNYLKLKNIFLSVDLG